MITKFLLLIYIYYTCSFIHSRPKLLKLRCSHEYLENLNNHNKNKPENSYSKLNKIDFDTFFINYINKNIKKAHIPSLSLSNRDRIILENNNNSKSIFFIVDNDIDKIIRILSLVNNTEINYISDSNFFNSIYSPYYYHK